VLGDGAAERREGREGRGGKLRGEPWLTFVHRLAAHHRIPNVADLCRTLSVRQVRRWLAFYRLEPFGNEWRRIGRATALVCRALNAKVSEEFEDMFLPTYDPSRPTQTPEEMARELAKLKHLAKPRPRKDAK
jgi:hypothetical protein